MNYFLLKVPSALEVRVVHLFGCLAARLIDLFQTVNRPLPDKQSFDEW